MSPIPAAPAAAAIPAVSQTVAPDPAMMGLEGIIKAVQTEAKEVHRQATEVHGQALISDNHTTAEYHTTHKQVVDGQLQVMASVMANQLASQDQAMASHAQVVTANIKGLTEVTASFMALMGTSMSAGIQNVPK